VIIFNAFNIVLFRPDTFSLIILETDQTSRIYLSVIYIVNDNLYLKQ